MAEGAELSAARSTPALASSPSTWRPSGGRRPRRPGGVPPGRARRGAGLPAGRRRAGAGGRHGHAPAGARRVPDAGRAARGSEPWSARPGALVVVLVDVRDPGNAGTVLRGADAVGVDRWSSSPATRSTPTTPRRCGPRPARSSTCPWPSDPTRAPWPPSWPTGRLPHARHGGARRGGLRAVWTGPALGRSSWATSPPGCPELSAPCGHAGHPDGRAGPSRSTSAWPAPWSASRRSASAGAAVPRHVASQAAERRTRYLTTGNSATWHSTTWTSTSTASPPTARGRSRARPRREALNQVETEFLGKRSALTRAHRALGGLTPRPARRPAGASARPGPSSRRCLAARRAELARVRARRGRSRADRLDLTEVILDQVRTPPARGPPAPVTPDPGRARGRLRGHGLHRGRGARGRDATGTTSRRSTSRRRTRRGACGTPSTSTSGEPETVVLRTHTSPVQIHLMEAAVRDDSLPIHAVMPGVLPARHPRRPPPARLPPDRGTGGRPGHHLR